MRIKKELESTNQSVLDAIETPETPFVFDAAQYEEAPEESTPEETNPGESDPEAPFGRNPDGSPIAPYGISKKGKVKKVSGRPSPGEKENEKDDKGELFAAIKEDLKETPVAPVPEKKQFKVFINGSMFLLALDFIFPGTIAMAYNFVSKSKVNRDDLCMTPDERKELTPLADEIVQELLQGLTPLQQFLIYTGVMYGTKLSFAPKQSTVKKQIKKQTK